MVFLDIGYTYLEVCFKFFFRHPHYQFYGFVIHHILKIYINNF